MSGFTYAAGSTTPSDPAGLIEWTGARFGSDGSLRALLIPPLWESAPLRMVQADLPGDGAFVADPKLAAWEFDIKAWLLVNQGDTTGEDVQSAVDYVRTKVNVYLGWQDVLIYGYGWAEAQQMRLRVAGQVTFDESYTEQGQLLVPRRDITIPVIAADPRRYSTTLHSQALNGSLVNAGNYPTPFTATFTATTTWVNPQINGPGAAGANRIRLSRTLAAGETVTVNTYDPDYGQLTAVDNTGANAYGDLAAATARVINPGTEAWTTTQDSGAGTATVAWRDARA